MRAALLGLLLLAAACDGTAEGRAAWRAGRTRDALAAFAGDSPELCYDRALAALELGELDVAERAADEAARADPDFAARRDFLRGNVAFQRSLRAEADAQRPGAPASALERAQADAEDALAFWRRAAASRPDWPEARRNVERALLRLAALRDQRREGGGGSDRPPEPAPGERGPDVPPPPRKPDDAPDAADVAMEEGELPPGQVLGLLELLRRKEAEKRELRRTERGAASSAVEKDW